MSCFLMFYFSILPTFPKCDIRLSRSENSGVTRSGQGSGAQTVSEYMTDELTCEGSELSFEEVRAEKYFRKIRETKEKQRRENSKFDVR